MFNINDEVIYTYYKTGYIYKIHYDDAPNLYYSLILSNNKSPQTVTNNIKLLEKKGNKLPFDVNDKIIYIKKYKTKIYDIKNNKFKIKYNDNFKFVEYNKLEKIN